MVGCHPLQGLSALLALSSVGNRLGHMPSPEEREWLTGNKYLLAALTSQALCWALYVGFSIWLFQRCDVMEV